MRIGSSLNKEAARPTDLDASGVACGIGIRTNTVGLPSVGVGDFFCYLLDARKGGVPVQGVIRQDIGWQGRPGAGSDVAQTGKVPWLSVLFSPPVGKRKWREGIRELKFINVVEEFNR